MGEQQFTHRVQLIEHTCNRTNLTELDIRFKGGYDRKCLQGTKRRRETARNEGKLG